MYNQININHYQQTLSISRYKFAVATWSQMNLKAREVLLNNLCLKAVFAHRELPFLPSNVREAIISGLNVGR